MNWLFSTTGGLLVTLNPFCYLSVSNYTANPLWLCEWDYPANFSGPVCIISSFSITSPLDSTLTYFSLPLFCYSSSKPFMWKYASFPNRCSELSPQIPEWPCSSFFSPRHRQLHSTKWSDCDQKNLKVLKSEYHKRAITGRLYLLIEPEIILTNGQHHSNGNIVYYIKKKIWNLVKQIENIPFHWFMSYVDLYIHIQNITVIIRMFLFLIYLVSLY